MGSYDLYLRAIALLDAFEKDKVLACIELLDRAIVQDPKNSQAMAVAAYAHGQVVVSQWTSDFERHRPIAIDFAQ